MKNDEKNIKVKINGVGEKNYPVGTTYAEIAKDIQEKGKQYMAVIANEKLRELTKKLEDESILLSST